MIGSKPSHGLAKREQGALEVAADLIRRVSEAISTSKTSFQLDNKTVSDLFWEKKEQAVASSLKKFDISLCFSSGRLLSEIHPPPVRLNFLN